MFKNKVILNLLLLSISCSMLIAQPINKKIVGKNITIGIIGKSKSNPVFIAAYSGARVAAKEIGAKYGVTVTIDWQTPQTENPQEQAQAVD